MKGKSRRALLSLLSAVVLLISVTYAWILSSGIMKGQFVKIDFSGENGANPLNIVSAEIGVEFLYQDSATGLYVVKEDASTPLSLTGMVPNDMLPFKIRFTNLTGESQTVSLSMSGITTDKAELLSMMFVGASGGHGYTDATDANVVKPDNLFLCLSDATKRSTGEYDMRIYNALIIPPTTAETYVELDCFFWFNSQASTDLEGKTLSITNFRVLI